MNYSINQIQLKWRVNTFKSFQSRRAFRRFWRTSRRRSSGCSHPTSWSLRLTTSRTWRREGSWISVLEEKWRDQALEKRTKSPRRRPTSQERSENPSHEGKSLDLHPHIHLPLSLSLSRLCYLFWIDCTCIIQISEMKEQGGNNQRKQSNKRGHPNNRGGSQRPHPNADRPNKGGEEGQGFKKRYIKKNRDNHAGKGKPQKGGKKEERDLDRELRDYWITSKGQTADGNAVDIAKQKLNSEMDAYWKNKKQQPKAAE